MGRSRSRSRSRARVRLSWICIQVQVQVQAYQGAHKIHEIALKTLSEKIFCIQVKWWYGQVQVQVQVQG